MGFAQKRRRLLERRRILAFPRHRTGASRASSGPPRPASAYGAYLRERPGQRHSGIRQRPSAGSGPRPEAGAGGLSMLSFAYPWLALLLPLPLGCAPFSRPVQRARAGLRVPFLKTLCPSSDSDGTRGTSTARGVRRTLSLRASLCSSGSCRGGADAPAMDRAAAASRHADPRPAAPRRPLGLHGHARTSSTQRARRSTGSPP